MTRRPSTTCSAPAEITAQQPQPCGKLDGTRPPAVADQSHHTDHQPSHHDATHTAITPAHPAAPAATRHDSSASSPATRPAAGAPISTDHDTDNSTEDPTMPTNTRPTKAPPRPDAVQTGVHATLQRLGHAGPYLRGQVPALFAQLVELGLARADVAVPSQYTTTGEWLTLRPLTNAHTTGLQVTVTGTDRRGRSTERSVYRWHTWAAKPYTEDHPGQAELQHWLACARDMVLRLSWLDTELRDATLTSDGGQSSDGRTLYRGWTAEDDDGRAVARVDVRPCGLAHTSTPRWPGTGLLPTTDALAVYDALVEASEWLTAAQLVAATGLQPRVLHSVLLGLEFHNMVKLDDDGTVDCWIVA